MTERKNNRDDFSEKTKRNLKLRVGGRCSNPGCRVPTDAPSDEGPEKVNSIGEAAHITAAAPGPGARRYNKALKPEERRSITNGIWLCANCADKIDKDEETYTVALLHEWKRKAEESAKREQGRKKLPAEQDAVNILVTAATGQTSGFLPNLVQNAIKAESSYWKKIDPRCDLEINYYKGRKHYVIHANEIIIFRLLADRLHTKEMNKKIKESIKDGSDVVLDFDSLKFDGLPIIEKLQENSKVSLTLERLDKKAVMVRLKTVSPDSKNESLFYDLHGYAVLGTEATKIEAGGLGGLILTKIKIPLKGGDSDFTVGNFTFNVNFEAWENLELSKLQYFHRIYEFIYYINNDWKLNISIEIDGRTLIVSDCNENVKFSDLFIYLDFIKMAREISKKISCPLYYNRLLMPTDDVYLKTKVFYEVLVSNEYRFPFKEITRISIKLNNDGTEMLVDREDGNNFFSITGEIEPVKIILFGQELILPKLLQTITVIEPKIINRERENIKAGDLVEIELIPSDNCECVIERLPDVRKYE
uniref:hypothetical protein n=1 Tax=Candidatus Electronema sp. TaxID=2698783 RepID=UPI00405730F0